MILFPSIDLLDGQLVRFIRGADDAIILPHTTPEEQAQLYQKQGFKWLHVVDLNGATSGQMGNAEVLERLVKAVDIPVQLGGGLRDMKSIEAWLARGVARVVVGTAAQRDPALVREACKAFPGRIAVSIDARGGRVSLSGWTQTTDMKAVELGLRFEDAGAAAIIYTDIGRSNTITGINVGAMADLAFALTTPLIASGGLATLDEIAKLRRHQDSGIIGVICGRALQDGLISAPDALEAAGSQEEKFA